MKKRLTLRDIARLAGVSHTTVSRVLNNDHRVRPETAGKVRAVADRHHYRVDPLASRLARGQSHLIALMVSDIKNPFYAEMARGIEDQARKSGYLVIVCSTDEKSEVLGRYTRTVINAGIDGLIFASVKLTEPVVEDLVEDQFPLLMVNRRLKSETGQYVVLNNRKGAYLITQHLIENGYRQIAMITGPKNVSTAVERLQGYKQALKDNRIPLKKGYMHQVRFSRQSGFETAMGLLEGKARPEAIFGGNDYIAMGIMDAAEQMDLKIPKDLAVVGFDDTEFAPSIRLTTVSQHIYTMGALAVKILIRAIEQKDSKTVERITLEPTLIVRESSRPRNKGTPGGSNRIGRSA